MIIDDRDKSPEEEFVDDLQEYFTHVQIEDYSQEDEDIEEEYHSMLDANSANRRRAQKTLDKLKANEDQLKYSKTGRNGADIRATNQEILDRYE